MTYTIFVSMIYRVECRYNAVRYSTILHSTLQRLKSNINRNLNPQKTPHISPWRASYGVSLIRIVNKIGRVITVPHCTWSSYCFWIQSPISQRICDVIIEIFITVTSQWRGGVSNHRRFDCLLSRLFRGRSNKTSKLRVTDLCAGIHRWPVKSPHKGPVTRKCFHLMTSSYKGIIFPLIQSGHTFAHVATMSVHYTRKTVAWHNNYSLSKGDINFFMISTTTS